MHKTRKIIAVAISAVLSLFFVLAGMALLWMNKTWGALTTEEFFYTITTAGAGTSKSMVQSYIKFALVAAIPLLIVLAGGFILFWKKKKPFRLFAIFLPIAAFVFLGIEGWASWQKLGVTDYLENQGIIGNSNDNNDTGAGNDNNSAEASSDVSAPKSFIDANYVEPDSVDLVFPQKKRNLIYIYLESMEVTSMDEANGGALPVNTIPELTELARKNETFSGADAKTGKDTLTGGFSAYGSTWTVGAMFAQSSGLPLSLPFLNETGMRDQDTFFPSAEILGDILEDEGYTQQIIFGSDKAFGGRDKMYRDHGNFDIHDYYWAIDTGKLPKDYYVWWGYEDEVMFDFAKEDLANLSKSGEPFNYTMLTVDTHFVGGYLCPDCPDTFDTKYANVMACSSKRVADFVAWIMQQDFYENTTVILAGDHPTMDMDYFHIDDSYDRRTYFTIINGAETPVSDKKRDYSTMDIFPTTLASLGVKIPGERLALGTNLYSDEETLLEKYGREELDKQLAKKSDLMTALSSDVVLDKTPPDYSITIAEASESENGIYPVTITSPETRELGTFMLRVWGENQTEDDAIWYTPVKTKNPDGDGEIYTVNIDLSLHGGVSGMYQMDLYWRNDAGKDKFLMTSFGVF
ncbi:MAG: sulfatase-like hydrolase/transferase [Lachnospiraceae bacterium]|jgi:phosphoglycerol transferase|nr:sulfatase-like hydrolase/transferase [Lachnospiraceae bacterium]